MLRMLMYMSSHIVIQLLGRQEVFLRPISVREGSSGVISFATPAVARELETFRRGSAS